MPQPVVRRVDVHDDAELDACLSLTALVFTQPRAHTPARRDHVRPRLADRRLTAAWDGPAAAATYCSWDWSLTVPGGSVTADAVSAVTVRPDHRRRGLLTSMIVPDLADARGRGVPVAVLVASEATIYRRFGFGIATRSCTWTVDLRAARLDAAVPRAGTVEVTTLPALRDLAPGVFERARRPGATDRNARWWDEECRVVVEPGRLLGPAAAAVHRDPAGRPQGYVMWDWAPDSRDGHADTIATVRDLHAATPEAYAALWGLLLDLDLVARVEAIGRPVDEMLPHLLKDPRAARCHGHRDLLWTRLLDPVTALAARTYASPGRAVVEVLDAHGWAAGVVGIEVADDGTAEVVASPAEPADLTLGVDVLSSVWLGGGDLTAAAAAGRVAEHRAGAVQHLARLLRTDREPWTGDWF